VLWAGGAVALAEPLTPSQVEFFEQRIRPVLANDCYECHGAKKQKGGLRLDSRDGLKAGGDTGPVLIPGDARRSLLIQSITHAQPDLQMPKDRPKLSASVLVDFTNWVNAGAPDPRDAPPLTDVATASGWDTIFRARREWWSFQPVQKPPIPGATEAMGSGHPVDQFIRAKLKQNNLSSAPPAGRTDLIRRVTYVLTGLPPTPEDVAAFLQDPAPDAFAKEVTRLLDSPRFGEHWARHWMDLVRFAETHGSEGDPEIPHAWRYRDYLVRAFNADLPADQLIREHLAGDLLPDPRRNERDGFNESLLGLTHLRLVEHGFQAVDTLDEQVKTVDSQIDVISKAFQGLTVSCARCHDHKFDPISQRDYYALYGVLASSRPTHLSVDLPERLRVHREELERAKVRIRRRLAEAWSTAADQLTSNLTALKAEGGLDWLVIPGDEFTQRITQLERPIAELNNAGRAAVGRARGIAPSSGSAVAPSARWTFDGGTNDSPGELLGGATVREGRLILDGRGAFFRSAALDRSLREKSLEAWVWPTTLVQRGGGVVTVETADGLTFDSLVFGESEARKWMAGSDGRRRSANLKGPEETAKPGEWIHLVVTYRTDHSIALYRNGEPYGAPYTPTGDQTTLRMFEANSARVLLGKRHTGGGTPFFAGEIEEARLYDRALTTHEVAASFRAGPNLATPAEIEAALTSEQRTERARLLHQIAADRASQAAQFPDYAQRDAARNRWLKAFATAKKQEQHPLQVWDQWRGKPDPDWAAAWTLFTEQQSTEENARRESNAKMFQLQWAVGREETHQWFRYGANPPESVTRPGEFTLEPEGNRILEGLLPAVVLSHRLSQKHNGVFASPPFKVTTDRISVRAVGGKGARVRLISDNYPLGQGGIFPQASLNSSTPTWVMIDTSYRKGSIGYLEFATAEDVTARDRSAPGPGGRSFFGVTDVVFHDAKETPKEELTALTELRSGTPLTSSADLAQRIGTRLHEAIEAWRQETLTEAQRRFLDSFVRAGLLPVGLDSLPQLAAEVTAYRRLETEIPVPRRIPGVVEALPQDAPLLTRGDHLRPADPVPRGYLRVVSEHPYAADTSGRLELAQDLTRPTNPLTSRVMVNRIWHHLFGRGLVSTVDNFGRLGEAPSHPELLDYLATHFVESGWSFKEMIRFLVLSQTWQQSSDASLEAREKDPANILLSQARVRRLEAESIRDSLLAVSGRLDLRMFGPGADAFAPPQDQQRRSVYLTIRRNFLSPFLEAFDAPKPFSTLGRRDTTNVPGQSLALLNDPFVIEQARQWAESVLQRESGDEARLRLMFAMAFSRPPQDSELAACRSYLADLAQAHGATQERLIWRDFGQSLFNLKEFIYLR